MNQLQRELLFHINENKADGFMKIGKLQTKTNRSKEKIRVELSILSNDGLIEIQKSTSGKIKSASINDKGSEFFKQNTSIISKENATIQLNELKEKVDALERAFNQLQENPTQENKKSLLEKIDTFQSVANGIAPIFKGITDLLT